MDQFEELLRLNAPEVQARFAALLGRLAEEADVHVLLSLRDDFLFRCSEQAALRPVFHDLTPLGPPSRGRRCGGPWWSRRRGGACASRTTRSSTRWWTRWRGERGALPLLAFAVSRLWEERDRRGSSSPGRPTSGSGAWRERWPSTRRRRSSQLGPEREGMVREIFRNLVTAQGTRAARDREELLSVFADDARRGRRRCCDALVDARLLTEYEADGGEARLAAAIADRDRARVAADALAAAGAVADPGGGRGAAARPAPAGGAPVGRAGTTERLLWTGTSYLDYRAWRARYAGRPVRARGGVRAGHDGPREPAEAPAADRRRGGRGGAGGRPRRRRRLLGRSETARRKADAEALRAEASKLLALGQRRARRYPTRPSPTPSKSLELADTEEARPSPCACCRTRRPPPRAAGGHERTRSLFAGLQPERRMARRGRTTQGSSFALATAASRSRCRANLPAPAPTWPIYGFGPDGDLLVGDRSGDVRVWSLPEGREVRRLKSDEGPSSALDAGRRLLHVDDGRGTREIVRWGRSPRESPA